MVNKRILPARKSTRLKGYDYSSDGIYFVTICTKNRECYFGDVVNGKMELNAGGEATKELWIEIPNEFKEIKLDAFVVMPNHLHGIVVIGNIRRGMKSIGIGPDAINRANMMNQTDAINRVPTPGMEINTGGGATGVDNPMLSKRSLSKIIRWFKGRCTFEIRKIDTRYFGWQSRFYDCIIRNKEDLDHFRRYIRTNPSKWESDQLNPKNPI